ncbi:MAG: epoxyqueuosine reductase QueH [Firmicutes bacterium]|nr:epoxyqueuosine reductase QueH [Bacillota bacterium]
MDLLLHTCCAPCSLFSWQAFQEKGYNVYGYFFNPNIHPYKEFSKRMETLRAWAAQEGHKVFIDERYLLEDYLQQVAAVACAAEKRCPICYRIRLEETARQARAKGLKNISTTLLISPYQKHELLRKMGAEIAQAHGVQFVYADLRPGFRESMNQAREKNLYRQGYCGCIYSEKERYHPESRKLAKQKKR